MPVVDLTDVLQEGPTRIREIEEVVHVKEAPPEGPRMENQTQPYDAPLQGVYGAGPCPRDGRRRLRHGTPAAVSRR